jgi:hypothetical protein
MGREVQVFSLQRRCCMHGRVLREDTTHARLRSHRGVRRVQSGRLARVCQGLTRLCACGCACSIADSRQGRAGWRGAGDRRAAGAGPQAQAFDRTCPSTASECVALCAAEVLNPCRKLGLNGRQAAVHSWAAQQPGHQGGLPESQCTLMGKAQQLLFARAESAASVSLDACDTQQESPVGACARRRASPSSRTSSSSGSAPTPAHRRVSARATRSASAQRPHRPRACVPSASGFR